MAQDGGGRDPKWECSAAAASQSDDASGFFGALPSAEEGEALEDDNPKRAYGAHQLEFSDAKGSFGNLESLQHPASKSNHHFDPSEEGAFDCGGFFGPMPDDGEELELEVSIRHAFPLAQRSIGMPFIVILICFDASNN